jgi:hypothetical protein
MLPEPVVGMARNGWTASIGIHGRHGPDYAFLDKYLARMRVFETGMQLVKGESEAMRMAMKAEAEAWEKYLQKYETEGERRNRLAKKHGRRFVRSAAPTSSSRDSLAPSTAPKWPPPRSLLGDHFPVHLHRRHILRRGRTRQGLLQQRLQLFQWRQWSGQQPLRLGPGSVLLDRAAIYAGFTLHTPVAGIASDVPQQLSDVHNAFSPSRQRMKSMTRRIADNGGFRYHAGTLWPNRSGTYWVNMSGTVWVNIAGTLSSEW